MSKAAYCIRKIVIGIAVIIMASTLRYPLNIIQAIAGSVLVILGIAFWINKDKNIENEKGL